MPSSSKRSQRRAAQRQPATQQSQAPATPEAETATRSQPPPPATPPPKPSAPRRGQARRRRDWTSWVFAGAVLAFALAWGFGITWRGPLFDVDIDLVRTSGIHRVAAGSGPLVEITLTMAAITAMYLVCLWALRKGFRHSFLAAVAGCVIVGAAVLPGMPMTSPDSVHLAADVRTLFIHHTLPFTSKGAPSKQTDDPIAKEVRAYPDQQSTYGPVAYIIGGAAIPFAGDSLRGMVLGMKLISGVFLLATAVLAGLVAKRLGRNGAYTVALVGMNPLFLWEYTGDGHNDTIMVAFGVLAMLFFVEPSWKRRLPGFIAGAASLLSKFALLLGLPVLVASWVPASKTIRLPWPTAGSVTGWSWQPVPWRTAFGLLAIVGGCIAVAAMMSAFFGLRRSVAGPIAGITDNTPWHVLQTWLDPSGPGRKTMLGFCYGGAVIVTGLIMIRSRLKTAEDVVAGIALAMGLFLFCFAPTLRHWYQFWAFPFIAIAGRRWLVAGAVAFSVGAFLPIFALNWSGDIKRDFGLDNSPNWMVVLLWVGVVATGLVVWWRDTGRARTQAARAGRRRTARVPARGRA